MAVQSEMRSMSDETPVARNCTPCADLRARMYSEWLRSAIDLCEIRLFDDLGRDDR